MDGKRFFGFIKESRFGVFPVLLLAAGILFLTLGTTAGTPKAQNEESRLEEICSHVEGVGKCRVILNEEGGRVTAAAVICRGAVNATVRRELTEMISSLYGIGSHRITVLQYN